MIRLNSIYIKGFKDPDYEKRLTFSEEPISVVYGENGSGKTTFLKIIFAVLDRNDKILIEENVQKIVLDYAVDGEKKQLVVERKGNTIDWGDSLEVHNTSSILFGVHRGMIHSQNSIIPNEKNIRELLHEIKLSLDNPLYTSDDMVKSTTLLIEDYLIADLIRDNFEGALLWIKSSLGLLKKKYGTTLELYSIENKASQLQTYLFEDAYQSEEVSFLKKLDSKNHILADFVEIKDIQHAIVDRYNKGQKIISEKIKKAFFETIEKAVEIDETNEDFVLPENFDTRIEANKDFITQAILKEDSSLTKRITKYLETGDKSLTENSKIFRAMLLNIVEGAEEPNPTFEAVTKLVEIFNEHLYQGKKLIVDHEKAYIQLTNGKTHYLQALSSGERNMLSILTLFLIIGSQRDFLMIDEPEISFNLKWQRSFLPLLSRLNSNAQIIVASHSPAIPHNNSNYLVELK